MTSTTGKDHPGGSALLVVKIHTDISAPEVSVYDAAYDVPVAPCEIQDVLENETRMKHLAHHAALTQLANLKVSKGRATAELSLTIVDAAGPIRAKLYRVSVEVEKLNPQTEKK